MKKYEVIAAKTTFPAGSFIELSPEQAKTREPFLKRKNGNVYQALESLSFKAGEVIGLPEENLSRLTLACLKPVEKDATPVSVEAKIVHIGGGKYTVTDGKGERLCDPGTKEQAEAFLKERTDV